MVTDSTPLEPPRRKVASSWSHLSQAVQSAFDLRKVILASLGLLVLHSGWSVLDRMFPDTQDLVRGVFHPETHSPFDPRVSSSIWDLPGRLALRVSTPARMLAAPLISLFELQHGANWYLHALLAVLWALVVWGLVGGAITRSTLVKYSGAQSSTPYGSLAFALRHASSLVGTPLLPLVGVGLCAIACAGFGLIFRLPAGIGRVLGGVMLFIPLSLALLMAILLVGLLATWPLMHVAIAAEAEDTLDALSRSFSYFNQRLGRYISLIAIAWLLGVAGLFLVDVIAFGVIQLTVWSVGLAAPAPSLSGLIMAGSHDLPGFWRGVVDGLVQGWAFAYFWTTFTYIYLILRHDVDGTPMTDVKAPSAESAAVANVA
jgi:hypothetical protein